MKNINLKIFIIAIFLLSFSAFSQDSHVIKSKCDSLKAAYEAKMNEWKKVEISMKSNDLTKTRYDELLPVYNGLWKEVCELQKKWFICKADTTKIKTISSVPPPPPLPPKVIEEKFWHADGPSTRPVLSEESKTFLRNYFKANYPVQAKIDSLSGVVVIRFICNKDGFTENISIAKEDPPNCGFGELSVEAFKKLKFTPAINCMGKPESTHMSQKIKFEPPKKDEK